MNEIRCSVYCIDMLDAEMETKMVTSNDLSQKASLTMASADTIIIVVIRNQRPTDHIVMYLVEEYCGNENLKRELV